MKSRKTHSIWQRTIRPPALVLLADSDEYGLWVGAARDLVAELRQRMPAVAISSAAKTVPHDLRSALTAAAFLGASSVIVVDLWGRNPRPIIDPRVRSKGPHLDVLFSESPPDVEAIVASYHSGWLALAADDVSTICN